ncbi:MAG: zinc-ribbon domain-containing protein [Candidatus Methanomethylophilaceae archaeon]
MFCQKCGKENEDSTAYCSSCGNRLGASENNPSYPQNDNSNTIYVAPQKSTGLGIILSFLFVGLGHLYAGLITKGLLLIVAYFILLVIGALTIIGLILPLILWIWGLYDTNKTINRYNEQLRKTGNPPW